MKVFGSSGTRGIANEEVTPEFVLRIGKAVGSVWDVERVAVARDTRYSGSMLVNAVTSGLASTGVDVDLLGIVPIPGAQVYAERGEIPAVMVTASHNPPQYNGIKLIGSDGVELSVSDLETVEQNLLAESFDIATWDKIGDISEIKNVRHIYIDELYEAVNHSLIADAGLTVALDSGHGAGAVISPEFFRKLGCRVITLNEQVDGRFPGRDPEPIPENLTDLGHTVRTTDADLGIAHDGDADRAIFFDETGEYIEGDATLAALAAAELNKGDTTVSAVNVSQRLVDVVSEVNATLELTPIGSTNIITRIKELETNGHSVPIAGEGNGGVFFPRYRLARDGAYTAAKFLELLVDRSASEIVAPFNKYTNIRRKIPYKTMAEHDAMLDAAADHAEASDAELTTRDGFRLDFGDAWVLARPSGTEPFIRIYAEARSCDRANILAEDIHDTLSAAKIAA